MRTLSAIVTRASSRRRRPAKDVGARHTRRVAFGWMRFHKALLFRGINHNVARSPKRREWYRYAMLSDEPLPLIWVANGGTCPSISNIINLSSGCRPLHYATYCQAAKPRRALLLGSSRIAALCTLFFHAVLRQRVRSTDCAANRPEKRTTSRDPFLLVISNISTNSAPPAPSDAGAPRTNHVVNVILTIPERRWRVRSLPMKEGVLTWEQCSKVQVPTKLLREPT